MSKYIKRKKVTGKHSEIGYVAGDDDLSSAWLKRFTPKGSVRLYAFQSDNLAEESSVPKYRTVSPDEIFKSDHDNNENERVNGNTVNGHESQDVKAVDQEQKSASRYRKKQELEAEKRKEKKKQQEELEKQKEKERVDREEAKEKERAEKEAAREKEKQVREKAREEKEKRRLQRKKEKYSHAGSTAQIVSKKKKKEEREKAHEKKHHGNESVVKEKTKEAEVIVEEPPKKDKDDGQEMTMKDEASDVTTKAAEVAVSKEAKEEIEEKRETVSDGVETEEEEKHDEADGSDGAVTVVQTALVIETQEDVSDDKAEDEIKTEEVDGAMVTQETVNEVKEDQRVEETEQIESVPVRPELMKIDLPEEDAKENHQHIEVCVEIKNSDDERTESERKSDQGHRPHSDVVVTEQMVRQIEQRGAEGSVSSRASSAVAVPRTMIHGRSWNSTSRASANQVLQNVSSNGEAGSGPRRNQTTRRAELVFEFGRRGTAIGRLRRPHGVAVTIHGDIIVCDSGNHRVQIFGWDCKFKRKWSPDTLRRRLFTRERFDPGDVAIAADNTHFIVTDFTTERLYKVSLESNHSKEFGKSGFKGPWGVAVNSHGYIYISYCISNCIICYDKDGKFVHKIGQKGVGPAEFNYPCYLAINKRDAIIVAEYHNRRVQILNPDGEFMFQIGNSDHFREISGVAVDVFNNVFVADYKCHRVVMYGKDGAFKLCIGDQEDKLDRPEGVTISPEGYVVVSDSGNHSVKVFRHWDVKQLLESM